MNVERFPTLSELQLGFARQQAADAARGANPSEPVMNEVQAELAAEAEAHAAAAEASRTVIFCDGDDGCGLVFNYKTEGMAKMQRSRHQRTVHGRRR